MKRLYSYILMSFLTFISINVKAQRIAVKTNMLPQFGIIISA